MTREELLAKMAQIAHTKDANEARNDYLLALRAVVELSSDEILNQDTDLDYGFWDVDISNADDLVREAFARGYAFAMQKTIQVIEKELG